MNLSQIKPNQSAVINYIDEKSQIKRRFQDLGIISGTLITCTSQSPLGNPKAYKIRNTIIAIRNQDAKHIHIREVSP